MKVVAAYPGFAMISRDGPTEVTQSTLDTIDAAHSPSPMTTLPSAQQFRNTSGDSAPSVATPSPVASVPSSTLNQTTESPSRLHYRTLRGRTIKPPVRFGYGENVV